MNASAVLVQLFKLRATLWVSGERLGVRESSGALTPELRAAIALHKPALLRLLMHADTYRTALREVFPPATEDWDVPPEAIARFLDEQARLVDELGPDLAAAVREEVGARWREETGICPWSAAADGTQDHPVDEG